MAAKLWFSEGASAQSAGLAREACPHDAGEPRREWFVGFDEAARFEVDMRECEAGWVRAPATSATQRENRR